MAEKAEKIEKYKKSVAEYYVECMVDDQVQRCVNVNQVGSSYSVDLQKRLDSIRLSRNKTYERAVKKFKMTLNSAEHILGSQELRRIVRKRLERYKSADDCAYSPKYLEIAKRDINYNLRPYARQLDEVILYFNNACQGDIVPTFKSAADEIEREKAAEKARIERLRQEQARKERERADKEPVRYAPHPPVPEPERKKKDTWSR